MIKNNIIPNVNPGDIVGDSPTFPTNAKVVGDELYLRDEKGNIIHGRSVDDGDSITVLDISYGRQLALIQYPTGSGYRQGYVTNATNIIKYKDDYSWVNGSTPEPVYDLDKTTQIGTLDPRERAVVLYKVDGMTAVAYDTGKGKLTKSGLVHYDGAGGSTGGGSINGVAPGEVVQGGFTYENNAEVVGDELYLRDANGNLIPGRSVSVGDKITVLDVSYSKQLALVQYPAGNVVRQGYVTNATNLIRYFKQGEWLNGSTTEPVLDENGGSLGSLSPYEAATPLYKKNGMIHVVYDTSKGPNTKSGYVKFEGLAQLPDTSIQIPSVSHSQATVEVYGTSGKGRPLKVYKIGNGSKVLFAGFAIHGWEDRWDNDGLALVNIANSLISKIGDYKAQNGLHGWTVYIAPCMNPDGVIVRGTNNGPGRCAVKSRIDINRCFPRGFKAQYNSRNYTGPNPLGAQEAVALKEFIEKINRTADELVVIDGHGWLGCTYGDSSIAQYFTRQFGFSHNGPSGGGYFSYWAQGLPRTRGLLLEYPDTYSYGEVISRNYIGKTFNAIINILKNNPNGGSVDSGNSGNGGSTSSEGSSSSADISYTATGEVINVQSFLNVRKGPGTNYDSIGQLHQGEIVNIVAKNEKWYKIKYGSGNAYVNFDYIAIIYNKKISLENWQEDCIKRGWGPITKEAYIEKINAVKLNKCLKDDIDDLVKKNLLRDTFDFLNPSKSDAISFANSLINDSTVRKFNDNRKGIFYFKETYESSARKEMSKFRAYKRLDNGQILRTIDLDIPIDKSKLSVRVKNSVKDVWKIKFLKGIDKVLVPLGFSIAVGTDFSVFLSEDELKSNDEIAAILAAVVVTNGLEVLLCSTIGAIATQIIGPEFPVVGAVVGGLAGAFAGYIIGKNLNNIEMERYLKNLILKILSLLE